MMDGMNSRDLDNHITGHYGEDQYDDSWDPYLDEDGDADGEDDDEWYDHDLSCTCDECVSDDDSDDEFPAGASIMVVGRRLGVAWRVECVRYSHHSVDRVRAHMVGDDRTWEFEREECTLINEDDFCHECGQIGCTADGRERD